MTDYFPKTNKIPLCLKHVCNFFMFLMPEEYNVLVSSLDCNWWEKGYAFHYILSRICHFIFLSFFSFFFRSSFAIPSLLLRSSYDRRNGYIADLQRNYLGWIANCLEGNTMSNRGAYSTKERMPSDRKAAAIFTSLEGCTWLVRISPFIMYCLPGSWKIVGLIPAHLRFTRMYGVTNRTVFQTVQNLRRIFL